MKKLNKKTEESFFFFCYFNHKKVFYFDRFILGENVGKISLYHSLRCNTSLTVIPNSILF